jgi:CheY-like chemotaxis protein
VVVARNGVEAIIRATEEPPALILMDMQMPEMSGMEALHSLRATPRFASIPIIAMTALAMSGDRERCLLAGANEYLSKPVSLKRLRMMIEAMLLDVRAPTS